MFLNLGEHACYKEVCFFAWPMFKPKPKIDFCSYQQQISLGSSKPIESPPDKSNSAKT